jgi:hypothetical protein
MSQKWFESVGWRQPRKWVKYNLKNFSSLQYLTWPYNTFYSCKPLQTRRLKRLARTMAQTMRFVVRKCLSGIALKWSNISESKPRKPQIFECQIASHINVLESLLNEKRLTKNFNGPCIQNRGWRIEWWCQFCFRTPPSGQNYWVYCRSRFKGVKIANNVPVVRDIRKT